MRDKESPLRHSAPTRRGRRGLFQGAAGLSGIAFASGSSVPAAPALAQAPTAAERRSSLDNTITVGMARLNELAAAQHAIFNEGNVLPAFDAASHSARSDVRLHRITTWTRVPETQEEVKVSGLLAVPAGARGRIPVVSWQHGTIIAFDQVPSNLTRIAEPGYALVENVDSAETLLNVQRFAGNGFAVIAADYLGKGPYRDGRPEAYAVKDATTRTCVDILDAGLAGLRSLGLEPGSLFLNGWSQGALNTQWLAQELQQAGRPVLAAAAASPFNDLNETLRYWIRAEDHPAPTGDAYPPVPDWVALAIVILLGSYEANYRLDGLMRGAVRPEFLPFAQNFWRDYTLDLNPSTPSPNNRNILVEGVGQHFTSDIAAAFLRRLAANRATYWDYTPPIRFYYGLADNVLHPVLARRPLASSGPRAEGIAVAGASHRATFLASLYGAGGDAAREPDLLRWFNTRLAG